MNQQEQLAEAFSQFQQRYINDPVLFVKEVLKLTPDKWQDDLASANSLSPEDGCDCTIAFSAT